MRYSIDPAEKIRKSRRLTPEAFSIALDFTAQAYPKALKLKRLTRRMAREVSLRYGIRMSQWPLCDEDN